MVSNVEESSPSVSACLVSSSSDCVTEEMATSTSTQPVNDGTEPIGISEDINGRTQEPSDVRSSTVPKRLVDSGPDFEWRQSISELMCFNIAIGNRIDSSTSDGFCIMSTVSVTSTSTLLNGRSASLLTLQDDSSKSVSRPVPHLQGDTPQLLRISEDNPNQLGTQSPIIDMSPIDDQDNDETSSLHRTTNIVLVDLTMDEYLVPVPCSLCQRLIDPQLMSSHRRRYHSKPVVYKCVNTACTFTTGSSALILRHVVARGNTSNLQCALCLDRFHTNIGLTRHLCKGSRSTESDLSSHHSHQSQDDPSASIESVIGVVAESTDGSQGYFTTAQANLVESCMSIIKTDIIKGEDDDDGYLDTSSPSERIVIVDVKSCASSFATTTTGSEFYTTLNAVTTSTCPSSSALTKPYRVYNSFQCSACPRSFFTTHHLHDHYYTHSSGARDCRHCQKPFLRFSDVKRHQVMCRYQQQRVRSKSNFYDSVSVLCPECPYMTKRPSDLERHKGIHFTQNTFKCQFCTGSFNFLGNRTRHLWKVHGRQPQQDSDFSTTAKLVRRSKESRSKPLKLQDAGSRRAHKSFKTKKVVKPVVPQSPVYVPRRRRRKVRRRRRREVRPRRILYYYCQACPFVTCRPNNFENHRRCHEDKLEFKCHLCTASFRFLHGMKNHLTKDHKLSKKRRRLPRNLLAARDKQKKQERPGRIEMPVYSTKTVKIVAMQKIRVNVPRKVERQRGSGSVPVICIKPQPKVHLVCPYCQEEFDSVRSLKHHIDLECSVHPSRNVCCKEAKSFHFVTYTQENQNGLNIRATLVKHD